MPYKDKNNRSCGFLDIEEKEKSSKYVRRYMRLDTLERTIKWFADNPSNLPKDAGPYGTIDVNYITKVDTPQKPKLKAKHTFNINTPMRRFNFQANDEKDLLEWVEVLNNASKIVVSDEEEEKHVKNVGVNGKGPQRKKSEDFSYKTEIVAGVVIQKKVYADDDTSATTTPVKQGHHHRSNSSVQPSQLLKLARNDGSFQRVIKKGWAVKQGHVRKNWKRRYFVLRTSGFSYYKSDQEHHAIRNIPIHEILAAKQQEEAFSDHKDNLFFVATTDRIYYIQANSPLEMDEWIKAFNDCVTSSRPQRSKGSEPGDQFEGRKGSGASLVNSNEVPRRRKVESTLSLASPTQRNSSIISGRLNSSSAVVSNSPVNFNKQPVKEDVMASPIPKPGKKKNNLQKRVQSIDSSSEESGGFSSSVDSLSANHTEGKTVVNIAPKTRASSRDKKKMYKRSSSGSELIGSTDKSPLIPLNSDIVIDSEENRHSFPSSKSVSVQVKPENLPPASSSFSSPTRKNAQKSFLSSQSFSNPNLRPSRSFLFDPKVDHRAAVKPSTVVKKRNTGILFSLNNMLNKKVEKMKKNESRK